MKITKDYPGLTRAKNGDYILNGSLISDECIDIELDARLVVTGYIISLREIKAVLGIEAGGGIEAGWGIEAVTYIDCGKRIFAGTSVYNDDDDCDKTIKCAELRNGMVAYGDLVITKQEVTHED